MADDIYKRQRQSLYFPEKMIGEIHAEAKRLDRPVSWIIQQAWSLAKAQITALPSQGTAP